MSEVLLQRMHLDVKAERTLTCIDEAMALSPAQSQCLMAFAFAQSILVQECPRGPKTCILLDERIQHVP
jgi:hypothetical protein